jgi:hypothetical protein
VPQPELIQTDQGWIARLDHPALAAERETQAEAIRAVLEGAALVKRLAGQTGRIDSPIDSRR